MTQEIEAETVLQPSLHSISEYVGLVLDEAESRDIDVSDLRAEYDADPDGEFINEQADKALSRMWEAGYHSVEQDDVLLIWPQGSEIPDEWQD